MHHLSRLALWSVISLLLPALAACAGSTPIPRPPTPTMEVAVFSTQPPTATITPSFTATPVPQATVGGGAKSVEVQPTIVLSAVISGPAEFGLTRPPDVNPLTGLKVTDQATLHRRPIMVRLGNDIEARPQVGLQEADLVYEELVEWWITRFTAIYLSHDLDTIGPVRSARLINLPLTSQYQGALAHSGGSDPVRWRLSQTKIVNLDEFFNSTLYFYRENEGWATRLAFNAKKAREYMLDEGDESDVGLRGFVFNPQLNLTNLPQEAVGDANEVIVPYPPQTSEVKWKYNPANGRYLRFITGEPAQTPQGDPLSAANVIIYFAEHQDTDIVEDTNGATSINIIMNGLGTAWLLRDGKILKGNWQTDGKQTPNFIFNDSRPMPLKPGNTWIEVLPLDYAVDIDGQSHTRLGNAATSKATATPGTAKTVTPTATPTPIGARATATPQK